jgi:hypothetical protein
VICARNRLGQVREADAVPATDFLDWDVVASGARPLASAAFAASTGFLAIFRDRACHAKARRKGTEVLSLRLCAFA